MTAGFVAPPPSGPRNQIKRDSRWLYLVIMILILFRFQTFFWNTWDGSSVGRAEDWKSSCRRFNSVPSHLFNSFKIRYLQSFCEYLFLFFFRWISLKKSKRTSGFELIYRYFERSICTQRVHTAFGFYRFHVNSRTWLGRSGDVFGVVL